MVTSPHFLSYMNEALDNIVEITVLRVFMDTLTPATVSFLRRSFSRVLIAGVGPLGAEDGIYSVRMVRSYSKKLRGRIYSNSSILMARIHIPRC